MNKKEMEAKILAMRKQGKCIREIARAIHKDDSFVSAILKAKKAFAVNTAAKKPTPSKAPVSVAAKAKAKKPCKCRKADFTCKYREDMKKRDAVDKLPKKPIAGTDKVRVALPKGSDKAAQKAVACSKKCVIAPCAAVVEISVKHDDIFTKAQMATIDELSAECSKAIITLMERIARINGISLTRSPKVAAAKPQPNKGR